MNSTKEKIIRKIKQNNHWYFVLSDILQVFIGNIESEQILEQLKQVLNYDKQEITVSNMQRMQLVECIDREKAIAIIQTTPILKNTIVQIVTVETI